MDPKLLARRRLARPSLENFNSEEKPRSRSPSPEKAQSSLADQIRKPDASQKTKLKEKFKKLKPRRSRSEKEREKQIRKPMFASTKSLKATPLQVSLNRRIGSERVVKFKTADQSEFILECKDELRKVNYHGTGRGGILFRHGTSSADSVNRYFSNEIGMNTEQLIRRIEPVLQKHAKSLESDAALFLRSDAHDSFAREIVSTLEEWLLSLAPSDKMASALGQIFQQIDANAAEECKKSPGLKSAPVIAGNASSAKYSATLGLLLSPVASKLLEYLERKYPGTPLTNQGFVNMINYMSREWEYGLREFSEAGIGAAAPLISDAQKTIKKKFQDLVEELASTLDRPSTESSSEDETLPQEIESVMEKIKLSHGTVSLDLIEKLKEKYADFPEASVNIEILSASFERLVSEIEAIQDKDGDPENDQRFENKALSAGINWRDRLVIDPNTVSTIKKLLKKVDQKSATLLEETPDDRRIIEGNTVDIKYAIVHALIIEPRLEEFSAQLEMRIASRELRNKIGRTLNLMFTPEFISHTHRVANMQAYERRAHDENPHVRAMLMVPFKS